MAEPTDTADQDRTRFNRLKAYVEEFNSLTTKARLNSEKCIDYYDSKQWTERERRALRRRKQPETVNNKVKEAVNGILGVVERGESSPIAYPRRPGDEDSADAATDALRFIADQNRFKRLRIGAFRDMLVPGTMAAIVEADQDLNVTVTKIRWEQLIADPRSREEDFTDARYLGTAKWQYLDDLKAQYPSKANDLEQAVSAGPLLDDTFNDRPNEAGSFGGMTIWSDAKRRRLMVVELYHREAGKWMRSCFHARGLLEDGPSPYVDEKGQPICPIVAQSAYVDRDNNRYSPTWDMLSRQDTVNKRESKLLHLLSTSQVEQKQAGAEQDIDTVREEAARPDGVLPFGFERVATPDVVAGHVQMLQFAIAQMERFGPNPAVLGREGADQSGRALLARQQAGMVELALLFGMQEDWELRIYRQCWMRSQQFWRSEQWVRVTDDQNTAKFVGLNQAVGAPMLGPNGQRVEGQPQFDLSQPSPLAGDTRGKSVFGYRNVVAEMDVDISLDSQPDVASLQQEQYQDLVQLVGTNPAYAQAVPFEALLRLSTIPHKREVLDLIEQARQQDQAQGAQQAQQAQQLQAAEIGSKIAKNTADAKYATARAETLIVGAHLDSYQAGMDSVTPPPDAAQAGTGDQGQSAPQAV